MNILGCLDRPTCGQYRLDGQDVSTISKNELAAVRNKRIGFVFQGFNLLSRTSALENVELPLLYGGVNEDGRAASSARRRCSRRSASATARPPSRTSCPAASSSASPSPARCQQPVDPARRRTDRQPRLADEHEVIELFQRLNDERGITVVLVTHEHGHRRYGTRIVVFATATSSRRSPGGAAPDGSRGTGATARGSGGGVTMSFLMVLRIAFKALARNKMRTALTMLGMIIGVSAVITMVALGTGAQSAIETQIQAAGTNLIMVSAGNFQQGGVRMGQGNASTLTPEDAMAIRDLPGVQYVAPGVNTRGQIVAGNITGARRCRAPTSTCR